VGGSRLSAPEGPVPGTGHGDEPNVSAQNAVLEASPNAIVAVDAKGLIVFVNPQVRTTFGYDRDEVVGKPIELLLPERVGERHVVDRDAFIAHPLARPMGIGLDLAGRRKDGTEFPVEISLSPVDTSTGRQVFATVVDITARKTAESALAESERRFRAVLEASPNAVVAIDAHGRIVYVNPQVEKTFGYRRDELTGQPIELLLPDRVSQRHIGHRDGFLAHPVARPMGIGLDLAGRHKDGTEVPVEISLSPVETDDGLQVFATVVDITARKAAENQLLQAQKLESIGRLAGGIAHDFNNMLFAIHGYAELLTQDLASTNRTRFSPERSQASVTAIGNAAERATALTAQLLAFSRQQVVSVKVLDLNDSVTAIEPMIRPLIGENMKLILKLDPDAGHIRADSGQIDQIVVNLIVNARDAMPNGGTVMIETGNVEFEEPYALEHFDVEPGPYVLLAVSDTGVGMDHATREHIFEPFFTTKEVGKGTGLGLATTYGIVRQAGGHIWLYSEPGHGSAFKLYFPRVDAAVEARPANVSVPSIGVGTVLVVEDEPAVRDMTTQLLERAGYEVLPVADAAEALASTQLVRPIDVLVTDVIMPNMSGIELAEQLMDRYPHLSVVLLSGYTAETLDLERVTARGATFVPKPLTSNQLLAAVQQAMSTARARSERR
jgi:PAS domain S-box-containing protein